MPRPTLFPILAAVLVAGCGASPADKSGATGPEPVTLTIQMPDVDADSGREFVRAVARRSEGSVRVRLGLERYPNLQPAHELELARAIERGEEQGGYLPARAWSAAGFKPFQALLAPFELTTPEAAAAFAGGDGARLVLDALPHEVVGLGLVPDQMRRIISTRPELAPSAFAGKRIRIIDDPQTAAVFRALHAEPVEGLGARDVSEPLANGRLDGAETNVTAAYNNTYGAVANHLTGYALFPKFQSLVLNRRVWDRLSDAQQDALRAAARDTLTWARSHVPAGERTDLSHLCDAGVTVDVPSATQLRALSEAARAATVPLTTDKTSAAVLAEMRRQPGAGARRLASPLPAGCTGGAVPEPVKAETPPFPEGTFVTRTTRQEMVAHKVTEPTMLHDITWTTRMHDGHWVQIQKPSFPEQCPATFAKAEKACAGSYTVKGDTLTFKWIADGNLPGAVETVRWSYFNGVLHMKTVAVADTGSRTLYEAPWRKAG